MNTATTLTETTTLPDGRTVHCVNDYEVAFNWHEIVSDDLSQHGLKLPADGTYVDVGANIGLFCLRLRDLCPDARICAFEPMPSAFEALQKNAVDMGGDIDVFRMALGSCPGEISFDYFPAITALSTADPDTGRILAEGLRGLLTNQEGSANIREIIDRTGVHDKLDDTAFIERLFRTERVRADVDTLDNIVARHVIEAIDLLKIDTEGYEQDVLDGIGQSLWPKIRQLMIEVHRGPEELRKISRDRKARGYRLTVQDHPMADGGSPVFHIYARSPSENDS